MVCKEQETPSLGALPGLNPATNRDEHRVRPKPCARPEPLEPGRVSTEEFSPEMAGLIRELTTGDLQGDTAGIAGDLRNIEVVSSFPGFPVYAP